MLISSAERYWDVTESRGVRPPVILPFTTNGALPSPLVEKACAPRLLRASRSGPIGLLRICSSPVKTEYPSPKAEAAVANLKVVPEFPTSITLSGTFGIPLNPSTIYRSFSIFTSAPIALHVFTADTASSDIKGFIISDLPSAKLAINKARMVCDLDPGILTLPLVLDLLTFNSILYIPPYHATIETNI